jgi:hypothetical protein
VALLVLETPVAIACSIGSDRRWIDGCCTWPAEIVITWETTKAHAAAASDYVRAQLVNGYEDITPSEARLTEMTPPSGVDDRD